MSYAAVDQHVLERTGSRLARTARSDLRSTTTWTVWNSLWADVLRTQGVHEFPQTTTTVAICFVVDALPIAEMHLESNTTKMLAVIESLFGNSASDMAKILRVSRPMIYHYREGMEPSGENRRRLQVLAALASDWDSLVKQPLRGLLKVKQPEGRSLLDFLSDEDLDVSALRRVLQRNIAAADQDVRNKLAIALTVEESAEARGDILRERHAAGKPVYVGDPDAPGKLIQVLPGGRRVRGRMVQRQFVPDEK